jgi:hypothetical protein
VVFVGGFSVSATEFKGTVVSLLFVVGKEGGKDSCTHVWPYSEVHLLYVHQWCLEASYSGHCVGFFVQNKIADLK